ncbi:MAG: amidohydrolase family protein [Pseudomonadales bacterium]|nr:amidohydrolase family protein [Pseudomonadales bacterium]MBO7007304.1 amidohydrolase family protein [Pseudomonadales bacterium]
MKFLSVLLLTLAASLALAGDIAVKGETVYTSAGEPIKNGVVIIEGGKITAVGENLEIPDGMKTLEAKVVTPGLIDARTVVGLAGYLNQDHNQDQLEKSAAIQPELRAIDAYNTREPLVQWLREHGITTINTGHGPGEIISGQTMIVKTVGDTVSEAVVRAEAMVASTLGDSALVDSHDKRKSPGTKGKIAAMLRNQLVEAQNYKEKIATADGDDDKPPPPRNLRLETMVRVLDGELPLLVTANRHNDIMTTLRIAEEFDIKIILDGAAESYLLIDEIKESGVSVIIHPQMVRFTGDKENVTYNTARKLTEADIPVAFQSGYEGYVPKTRVVLFEAAMTLPYGMSFEHALNAITINAAKILGVDDRIGSIEVGKDGDLALYDGDPFEWTSHAVGTVIEGKVVSDIKR